MSEESSLDDLLVDENKINEELLADTVGQYANIGSDSGELVPKPAYNELSAKKKVVVTLLAQKALSELDMAEEEWISPSEISSTSGVKKGTVYPAVRDLTDEGILRDGDGEYKLPSVNVEQAKEYLELE